MCQNQSLLKLFQYIVIQSMAVINKHLKYYFHLVQNKQFGQLINISHHLLTMFINNVNMTLIIGQIFKKMRYSTELKYRKYVEGFLSFARKFGDKCGKKLMDAATKKRIDAAKTESKRVIQNNAEATGDLIKLLIK